MPRRPRGGDRRRLLFPEPYVAATGLALWNAHAGLALSTALWLLWGAIEYSAARDGEAPDTTATLPITPG